jgi:hypothetical protein
MRRPVQRKIGLLAIKGNIIANMAGVRHRQFLAESHFG